MNEFARMDSAGRYVVAPGDLVVLNDPPPSERRSDVWRFLAGEREDFPEFTLPLFAEDDATIFDVPCLNFYDLQRLVEFAYLTRPFNWTDDPRQPSWNLLLDDLAIDPAYDYEESTQDLWDLLLAVVRADRFSSGTIASHSAALTSIANEIRRRLLVGRA